MNFMRNLKKILIITLLAICLYPAYLFAWPLDSEWIVLTKTMSGLTDIISDSQGGANDPRDIVTNTSTYPSAYLFNDGTYMFYRIRVDGDALNNQGTGLQPFGWGFLIDTDNDFSDYEWMVMLNGIDNPDTIEIGQNTSQGTLGDPSDKTEVTVWSEQWQLNVNFRTVTADSSTNGGRDYFLDFRIPYATFKAKTGLTDTSPIRFFIGSSNSAQSLSADLVDISNTCSTNLSQCMPANATDAVTPLGTYPATGTVTFVSNLAGTGDVTQLNSGQTLYINMTDQDVNTNHAAVQTLTVSVTSPTGDSETVTLTETDVNTGIFTGSLTTATGAPVTGNGSLQVTAIETVTVTYLDSIDASYHTNQLRTDTLTVQKAADLSMAKTADKTTPAEGETVTYTLTVTNNGPNNSTGIQVTDMLPAGVTWVSDSGAGTYNRTTGVWEVPSLANNANASLTITVTVNAGTQGATFANSASITASAIYDPVSGNNTASNSLTIGGADLALFKTVNNTSPPTGGSVVFTVTLQNLGSSLATGVTVTDVLSSGLTYSTSSATQGSYNSGTWTVGNLASGATTTLSITADVDGAMGTTATNTAVVATSDQADPMTANNSASVSVFISGVDLSLSKTVDNAAPNEANSITYTITVTNNGLYSAGSVTVSDLLAAGLTYVSSAGTGTYVSGSGLWSAGTIMAGGSAVRTITATVNAGTNGMTITNMASINGASVGDPNTANNTANASITVQRADLSVAKTSSNPSPNKNEAYSYSVVLTNNGPHPATNIAVRDVIDTGNLTYNSASATTGSVTYSAPTLTWTIAGPIASGASAALTINVTVKNATANGTTVHNMAEIVSAAQADPVNANNSSINSLVVGVGITDLAVTKSVNNTSPAIGATVTYTIVISNPSLTNATNVTVSDALPAGLTYAAGGSSVTQGGYNSGSGAWTVGPLNSGATATMLLAATVNAGTMGQTINNMASITAVTQSDINPADDSASASLVVGATDLAVTKTVDNATPNEGGAVVYTVGLRNNGPNNATTVVVTDLLPAELTLTSSVATAGTYTSVTGIWSIAALNSGATATLTINATVNTGTAGSTITNTAVRTSADQGDTNSSNNTASAVITVQSTDLYITKTVSNSTPNQGTTVVYTLTIGNSGPNNATGIMVSDLLPAGVTYVSDNGGGAYNSGTGVWTAGSVAKDATKALNITAMVTAGGVTITNSASITANDQTDPNMANNSSSVLFTSVSHPNIVMVKSVNTYSDPVNGTTSPKAIPGSSMQYTILATNTGGGAAGTVVVTDPLPSLTEFFAGDFGVAGSGPIAFSDGAIASGLSYAFGGLSNIFDSISFSSNNGATYDYLPVPDVNGFDGSVTNIKISLSGTFNGASGTNTPSFALQFRVRVK